MVGPPTRCAVVDARILLFLIFATTVETVGDAIERIGLGQTAWLQRCGLFLVGGMLLFGYGISLNLAPVEFSRVVGLYIATLFAIFVVFGTTPTTTIVLGGVLIVVDGSIVTLGRRLSIGI